MIPTCSELPGTHREDTHVVGTTIDGPRLLRREKAVIWRNTWGAISKRQRPVMKCEALTVNAFSVTAVIENDTSRHAELRAEPNSIRHTR